MCFILNLKDKRSKFKAKADEGIFLGYSIVFKAYRVFNKHSQTVEESPHVTFEEDAFSRDTVEHPASILEELISVSPEKKFNPIIAFEDTLQSTPEVPESEDQADDNTGVDGFDNSAADEPNDVEANPNT